MEGKIIVSGKRKEAIARAVIKTGSGKISVNNVPYIHLEMIKRLMIEEPVRIAKENFGDLKYDIEVIVKGGGQEGQIEAARLAIARAFVAAMKKDDSKKAEQLRKAYLMYDRTLLVADIRRKEACKPGDSKARSKRQKSYR
ncbi:MAG: 30S ribosomal protein S9 [Nanoarchaeota archaeon]|nr:30S ribosomal protein S9 [Nanoarchaeota archaeon]